MDLRGKRSRKQIANRLADLGAPLDESSLFQYEAGTVWAPDAGVMWGLAQIYGVGLTELVDLLRANRTNPSAEPQEWRDLISHGRTGKKAPRQPGESDDPAATRIRELENRVEELEVYETIVRNLRPIIRDAITTLGDEDARPAVKKATGRRSH